jgi:translation elongation factor EF-1beta
MNNYRIILFGIAEVTCEVQVSTDTREEAIKEALKDTENSFAWDIESVNNVEVQDVQEEGDE